MQHLSIALEKKIDNYRRNSFEEMMINKEGVLLRLQKVQRRSAFEEMMIKNEARVLQRLENLQRRSASLEVAVKELVVEIEEERRNCGNVDTSQKKEVLRVRMRRLFDANVRLKNLARNYKRKKNLQDNVSKYESSDEAGLTGERCGTDSDSEFDPSTVVVAPHDPPIVPAQPLPHRFCCSIKLSFLSSSHTARP